MHALTHTAKEVIHVETFDAFKLRIRALAHSLAVRPRRSACLSSKLGRFPPGFGHSNFLAVPAVVT